MDLKSSAADLTQSTDQMAEKDFHQQSSRYRASTDSENFDQLFTNRQSLHSLSPPPLDLSRDNSPSRKDGNENQKNHKSSTHSSIMSQMAESFQTSLSDIRIYENSSKAKTLGAQAFTQGNEIHFDSGQYQPNTDEGKKLIGHELALLYSNLKEVTGQMNHGGIQINQSPQLEKEADQMGEIAARGDRVPNILAKASSSNSPEVAQMKEEENGKSSSWLFSHFQNGAFVKESATKDNTSRTSKKYHGSSDVVKGDDGTPQYTPTDGNKSEKNAQYQPK